MTEEKLLKAKVNFHKTWMLFSLFIAIIAILGYEYNLITSIPESTLLIVSIVFGIIAFMFVCLHIVRYKDLIDFYYDSKP